jgi:hypothetical protein
MYTCRVQPRQRATADCTHMARYGWRRTHQMEPNGRLMDVIEMDLTPASRPRRSGGPAFGPGRAA